MAPKPREIDWDKLELFLKSGATQVNIAKGFGISDDTLNKRVKEHYQCSYTELSERMRSNGVMLIEATQLQKALQGNITMLVWLGKVKCGQREAEPAQTLAPNQDELDKDHLIMQLKYENEKLKESNADKS